MREPGVVSRAAQMPEENVDHRAERLSEMRPGEADWVEVTAVLVDEQGATWIRQDAEITRGGVLAVWVQALDDGTYLLTIPVFGNFEQRWRRRKKLEGIAYAPVVEIRKYQMKKESERSGEEG